MKLQFFTMALLLLAKELLCKVFNFNFYKYLKPLISNFDCQQPVKSSIVDRKFPFEWKDVFLKKAVSTSVADKDSVTKSPINEFQFSDPLSVPKKGIVDYIGKEILDPSRFQNPIISHRHLKTQ
jgi:hypothetical protein